MDLSSEIIFFNWSMCLLNRAMVLDVGGRKFKVLESNFNVYPNTRLGKLARARTEEEILSLCDGYLEGQTPEYFFDRNWTSFNSILDIYRTGSLHLNTGMCALVLQKDLEYWQIDELILGQTYIFKFFKSNSINILPKHKNIVTSVLFKKPIIGNVIICRYQIS